MTVKERLLQEELLATAIDVGKQLVSGYIFVLSHYGMNIGIPQDVMEKWLVNNREKVLESLYATGVDDVKGVGLSLAFDEETEPMMKSLRLLASEFVMV